MGRERPSFTCVSGLLALESLRDALCAAELLPTLWDLVLGKGSPGIAATAQGDDARPADSDPCVRVTAWED